MFSLLLSLFDCEQFHSLRTYRTSELELIIRILRDTECYNIARALVLSHSVCVSVLKIPIVPADSVNKLLRQKCFVFRASGHC